MLKETESVAVILLSACRDENYYAMNVRCLTSLLHSEPATDFEIVIIETSEAWTAQRFPYTAFAQVRVISKLEKFNYNRCLNLGLQSVSSRWVVFSNNDVIFHPGWLTEINKIRKRFSWLQSFSPFDRTSPYLDPADFPRRFYPGFRVPIEFTGWCFACDRSIFKRTGLFDETFDLYFQDNDFARTLKHHGILHAMVPSSFVEHSGGATTGVPDASQTEKYRRDRDTYFSKWNQMPPPSLFTQLQLNFKIVVMRFAAAFL